MKLTRTCQLDGKTYTMNIPALSPAQLEFSLKRWQGGELIQNAFPYLNADEREFIMTGTPPEVWDRMFADEGDDD